MLQYFDILDEANVESEKLEYVGLKWTNLEMIDTHHMTKNY